ncbi:MAG TPA: LysR substrate-binding domain-containing protein [Dongiaceae bacterium]|nr:LysR substrate-binding domain-containing protein [Dongiaceae bacterium]
MSAVQDLNDLFFFAEVVAHGGFAAAGRALRQPKSKLSRRVAQLEHRLGVQLIERSSRRFRVTDVGRAYYAHCRSALAEIERAEIAAAQARAEPTGLVRFSCPAGLMELIGDILPPFLTEHPKVKMQVLTTNRRVDLIADRIDVALRVRVKLDSDAELTMRSLAKSRRIVVASPALINRLTESQGADLADIRHLARLPTLSAAEEPGPVTWDLVDTKGEILMLEHEPRLSCGDLVALRNAAVAGLGIALLPDHICRPQLRTGSLLRLFPDWHSLDGIVHIVFTTSRGLTPAVRAWIDHLARHFADRLTLSETADIDQLDRPHSSA